MRKREIIIDIYIQGLRNDGSPRLRSCSGITPFAATWGSHHAGAAAAAAQGGGGGLDVAKNVPVDLTSKLLDGL